MTHSWTRFLFLGPLFAATSLSGGSFSNIPPANAPLNPPDSSLVVCTARTETGLPVNETIFQLEAPALPLTLTQATDLTGYAVLGPLDSGIVFTVTPTKNTVPSNGVTVGDLIAINKYILGIEPFASPYKMIAADVNRSGSITQFDVIHIRNIILGNNTEFPNSPSWRFIPSDFVFPYPNNPFQTTLFPDGTFTTPLGDTIQFTAIKVGDANGTADPEGFTTFDERDLQTLFFETENKTVRAGEEFIITFGSEEVAEGFQFTLHTDGLDILEVLPGAGMTSEHFAVFADRNLLTVACETAGKARFALKLKSRRSGELRDLLRLDSEITRAEAYLPATAEREAEAAQVALSFLEAAEDFTLYQNQPNPAGPYTDIAFYLPFDSDATLTMFDAAGRTVYSKSGNYKKGDQKVRVELNDVAPGVVYYQLQAGGRCAIRKMVRL